MLLSMKVRNIALMEELEIDFHKGLQVLSGETGAGKSILIDSLNLILGERADRGLIRSGCERAIVEACFDISDNPMIIDLMKEEEIEPEGSEIIIQREITTAGKNICRIGGSMIPLASLKKITSVLVDVHGQHDHQRLLDSKTHMEFLDSFGDEEFKALKKETAEKYRVWREASVRFQQLRKENLRKNERQEYLETRVRELDNMNLRSGEAEQLSLKKKQMAFSEKINESLQNAYHALNDSGHEESVLTRLKETVNALHAIENTKSDYASMAERMQNLFYEIEEMSRDIRSAMDSENFDGDQYERIEERLDKIRKLERKYQMTADELVAHHIEIKEELEHYQSLEDKLRRAENEFRQQLQNYRFSAAKLTAARKQLAEKFEKQMESQLSDLGMLQTRFQCVFEVPEGDRKVIPTAQGDDTVVFYIAPNPGEPLKPLDKTASGGELSRLMLALKTCAADRDAIPTIVFDEIDTGISGNVASAVAEKMSMIGRYHQILCITHLAQIAAIADTQFLVSKHVSDNRTFSEIHDLNDEERVLEIARLIGVTQKDQVSGMAHARALLESSNEIKRNQMKS